MTLHRCAEAFKVVSQEKTLDKCVPMAQPRIGVPRPCHRAKDEPRPAIPQGSKHQTRRRPPPLPQQQHGRWDQHSHRSLGEYPQGHPQSHSPERTSVVVTEVAPQVQRRKHQPQTQQGICRGGAGHGPRPQTAGKDHGSQHGGAGPPSLVGSQCQRQTSKPSGQGRRQSQGEFI